MRDGLMSLKPQRGHIIVTSDNGTRLMFKPVAFFGKGFETVPYNEILAYDISRLFNLCVVPSTTLRTLSIEIAPKVRFPFKGACQTYIDNVVPLHLFEGKLDPQYASELVLLDVITGNTDRKAENTLVEPDSGRVWGVDNGFSLGFHHPNEIEKRGKNYEWNISLLDTEQAYLRITRRLLENIDWDYLMDKVKVIQKLVFTLDMEAYFEADSEMVQYLTNAIGYRIKYLPALLGKQMEGSGGYGSIHG